ncbi:MAG: hypothetical protein HXL57_00545 [Solobacterium sp.]|nr:hypothetical protein [Solobacterium sp.]
MRKENIEKIVKFVGKLDAQYGASLYKKEDSNVITLSIEYYTDRFESRPCSGDIRNGVTQVKSIINLVETKNGMKILSAVVKGSTPHPENNWNGWTTFSKRIEKPTWSNIKRVHNSVLGGEVYNELYSSKGFIDRIVDETSKDWYYCTIGDRYDAYTNHDNIVRIKEAV